METLEPPFPKLEPYGDIFPLDYRDLDYDIYGMTCPGGDSGSMWEELKKQR